MEARSSQSKIGDRAANICADWPVLGRCHSYYNVEDSKGKRKLFFDYWQQFPTSVRQRDGITKSRFRLRNPARHRGAKNTTEPVDIQ